MCRKNFENEMLIVTECPLHASSSLGLEPTVGTGKGLCPQHRHYGDLNKQVMSEPAGAFLWLLCMQIIAWATRSPFSTLCSYLPPLSWESCVATGGAGSWHCHLTSTAAHQRQYRFLLPVVPCSSLVGRGRATNGVPRPQARAGAGDNWHSQSM